MKSAGWVRKTAMFLGKLKTAWDLYFKNNPQLILILCGSISSWIEENILSSTGFMGRISLDMILEELPLYECNEFWNANKIGYLLLISLKCFLSWEVFHDILRKFCLIKVLRQIFKGLFSKRRFSF